MSSTAPMTFQRIAYEALSVCNGVTMAEVEATVARTGLAAGARMIDIGTGNAAVSLHLAERFGLRVTAIELDPLMAELAGERIVAAGAGDRVSLTVGRADEVLARLPPVDLVLAMGTTNVTGEGRPTPAAGFVGLRRALKPGGWLLWGDAVWLAEPPAPLRQITEATNLYTDDAGWRAAAEAAGFEVVSGRISPQPELDTYTGGTVRAVRAWLEAHPDAPEAASIRLNADRVQAIFEFGRDYIGFGLYLLRNPD